MSGRDTTVPGLLDPAGYVNSWGQVAETASLTLPMLVTAYNHGVFPWTDNPVGWFCPHERAVLAPKLAHFPRNLPRLMRRARFTFRADTAFEEVVHGCAEAHAHDGVWLTRRFITAYTALHRRGFAHSLEVYQDDLLVGGLYGVQVGRVLCAESMFHTVSGASKAALYTLVQQRERLGIELIDVQVMGETTQALGALTLPRPMYLELLHTLAPQGAQPRPPWVLGDCFKA